MIRRCWVSKYRLNAHRLRVAPAVAFCTGIVPWLIHETAMIRCLGLQSGCSTLVLILVWFSFLFVTVPRNKLQLYGDYYYY
jgi:hypothetical protein